MLTTELCAVLRRYAEGANTGSEAPGYFDWEEGDAPALEEAAARLERGEGTCEWREDDDGNWETSCKGCWNFPASGPVENGVVFCPLCGCRVKIMPYEEDDGMDDAEIDVEAAGTAPEPPAAPDDVCRCEQAIGGPVCYKCGKVVLGPTPYRDDPAPAAIDPGRQEPPRYSRAWYEAFDAKHRDGPRADPAPSAATRPGRALTPAEYEYGAVVEQRLDAALAPSASPEEIIHPSGLTRGMARDAAREALDELDAAPSDPVEVSELAKIAVARWDLWQAAEHVADRLRGERDTLRLQAHARDEQDRGALDGLREELRLARKEREEAVEQTQAESREMAEHWLKVAQDAQAQAAALRAEHDMARVDWERLNVQDSEIDELRQQLRDLTAGRDLVVELFADFKTSHWKQVEALRVRCGRLESELGNIARANYREWEDGLNTAESFVAWAQSRARKALAEEAT